MKQVCTNHKPTKGWSFSAVTFTYVQPQSRHHTSMHNKRWKTFSRTCLRKSVLMSCERLSHLWCVPHTCCPGTPPPAWQWSSPPAGGWGACPAGWQQGSHSHTWVSAVPLSWWDAGSGRILWWNQALSIQKEGHTEHAQHRSLKTWSADSKHGAGAQEEQIKLKQSAVRIPPVSDAK